MQSFSEFYQIYQRKISLKVWLLTGAMLPLYLLMGYWAGEEDPVFIVATYAALFVLFLLLYLGKSSSAEIRFSVYAAVIFRLIFLLSEPVLNPDFYRFIWDGWLFTQNISPYIFTPAYIMQFFQLPPENIELFRQLNSPENFSLYPPLQQYVFLISNLLSPNSTTGSLVLMRTSIIAAEIGTLYIISKLTWRFRIKRNAILLYALNPLIIIELTGNMHFEAFMIFFTIYAAYFLIREMHLTSAVALGFAIAAKLFPLLFLPLLIKRLSKGEFFRYCLVTASTVILLFLPFYEQGIYDNFFSGISGYYRDFSFNASVFYILEFFIQPFSTFDVATILPFIVLASIATLVVLDKARDLKSWLRQVLWVYTIYLLLSTTVLPWHIAPLVAFCIFTGYRYPVTWSVLIPFSYLSYAEVPPREHFWVPFLQYFTVFLVMIFELFQKAGWLMRLQRWQILKYEKFKISDLKPLIPEGNRVIIIGAGNGGMTYLLQQEKLKIVSVDVQNRSRIEEVKPLIFDGKNLPYSSKKFDTALLFSTLDKSSKPEILISEALRVSNRIIFIEDVWGGFFRSLFLRIKKTFLNKTLHSYSNVEWREMFRKNGLAVVLIKSNKTWLLNNKATYLLEKQQVSENL